MPWNMLANVTGVEAFAGLDFNIVQTALAGVVLVVAADVIRPGAIYDGERKSVF